MADEKNTAPPAKGDAAKDAAVAEVKAPTAKPFTVVNGLLSTGRRVYKEWEQIDLDPAVAERYVKEGILREGIHKQDKGGKK